MNIFRDDDRFTNISEANDVLEELQDDIQDVQYPDRTRGLNASRNEVTNRNQKFIARCKLMQMRETDKVKAQEWSKLGKVAVKMYNGLLKTKDNVSAMFDRVW